MRNINEYMFEAVGVSVSLTAMMLCFTDAYICDMGKYKNEVFALIMFGPLCVLGMIYFIGIFQKSKL